MNKQDVKHFFEKHKTKLICLGVGIGIGAYATYRHYFGPISQDTTHVVLSVGGKDQAKVAEGLLNWWNAPKNMKSAGGACGFQTTQEGLKNIQETVNELGDAKEILWWIEKF